MNPRNQKFYLNHIYPRKHQKSGKYPCTECAEGESWTRTKHATVLDYNDDPEMERLLRHFDAKTWTELEAEKERLRRKVEKQNKINQQEAQKRRQNGKAIVDKILGTK